jgi:hypothetical protein
MKLQAKQRLRSSVIKAAYDKKLFSSLVKKLVPASGKADTLEGELLRATNRLWARFNSANEQFSHGAGATTCGSCATFMFDVTDKLRLDSLWKELAYISRPMDDAAYEKGLNKFTDLLSTHVQSKDGNYSKNTVDSMRVKSDFENEEDDYDNE